MNYIVVQVWGDGRVTQPRITSFIHRSKADALGEVERVLKTAPTATLAIAEFDEVLEADIGVVGKKW